MLKVTAFLPVLAAFASGFVALANAQAAADARPPVPPPVSAEAASKAEVEMAESAFTRGLTAMKAKRFEEARLLFQYTARNTDIHLYPLGWLTAQFNACHVLCLQSKNEEAEALARSLTSTCEAELGIEDPLTSEALSYLAFVLKHLGHPQDAEPVYRRTVQVLQSKYGPEHPQVATAMTKHAALLETLGQMKEAEALHRRALDIMKTIGQEDSSRLCVFLTNLAYCLQAEQRVDEAGQLMEKAYNIVQTTEDASLQSAGQILRKQTDFYRIQKRLDRAEVLGHRAILRLAKRPDINRARFFYYDMVADLYKSVLKARGMNEDDIVTRFQQLENEVTAAKATASVH